MISGNDISVGPRSNVVRRWAIRIGIALLVLEVVYVIAGNAFLRTGLLLDLINKKPEKTTISWDSATTLLPGVATVSNFELRSQTRRDQVYVRVAKADARISLLKLATKTIHIRGVDARDVDFRYRERLDRPPKPGREDEPREEPSNLEFWPEIPGFTNPPDPKPEDLYPMKKKKRPWTIKITGAEIEGSVSVALNELRIDGEGFVGGGVTVKPRETITIHRGRLGLAPTKVSFGPEVVTEDLAINADIEIETFPAKGAGIEDVLGGISGELSLAGRLGDQLAVRQEITPGISIFGAGTIAAHMKLKNGALRDGSEYSLESDSYQLRVMDLEATGTAAIRGSTEKRGGEHVTTAHIALGEFQFVDPEDASVDISGTGLELDAEWEGFSIAERVYATHASLVMPTARIHDVSTFNGMIPDRANLSFVSGTGQVEARLEVTDRVGSGSVDVVADEIVLKSQGTPFYGDLEVHARLVSGDLETRRFDLSGTTIRLDDVVDETESRKKQEKLEAWFCDVELQQGHVVLGQPLTTQGRVRLELYDTRAVMAMLKELGVGPRWLAMAPNIRDVEGTLNLDVDQGLLAFDSLNMTGDGFEALGWMRVENKTSDGRLFVRFKGVAAGVAMDRGKAKVQLSKPRQWFDEQPTGPGS